MKYLNKHRLYILTIALLAVTLACRAILSPGEGPQNKAERYEDSAEINILVNDFSYSLDNSQMEAGTITFVVKNDGSMPHDFAIRGNGVEQKTRLIGPGESDMLTVDLEPGTYTYVCTIPGHKQLGMSGAFTVASN